MNHITLIGNVTKDIEVKTAGTTKYVLFSLAVRRNYKNKAGNYDTDFLPCIVSGAQAETVGKFVKKGDKLAVQGNLTSKTVEGKGTFYTINVTSFDFLTPKAKTEKAAEAQTTAAPVTPDDLPFEV